MASVPDSAALPRRPLGNTGLEVSVLGFGASPLGGVFGPVVESDAVECVHHAFRRGINLFDTSPYYGLTKSETVLGAALRDLPRSEYVLSTKVGGQPDVATTLVGMFTKDMVDQNIDTTLTALGLAQRGPSEAGSAEAEAATEAALAEALRLLEPVKDLGWASGRPLPPGAEGDDWGTGAA
ncbi:hypothetical protein GPECTOR_185g280 [Gonium pectorale]|uniref:NADP-dependent oxidoreductase domain-containing protein n=1 Tax=Gonium pectorale TaxID=33097 RepID=A0A150FX89_GONPE|nr:hypothetical protein GPECTOR_185g280 [Gonium pectorale]|eukprot:KXZ42197.1 hypothetical protein GPECTOR_185g280 [Gonium pectorale]